LGAVEATLAAGPLAVAAPVIVAVEVESVAVQTQGVALGIVSSSQTGEEVFVLGVATRDDGAESLQVIVNEAQDVVVALTSVTDDLPDVEVGEAALDVLEAGDGLEMVVAIGRGERARDGPIGEETVIHDVEALRLVAEVMLAPAAVGLVAFPCSFRGGGIGGGSGLIGTLDVQ